VDWLQFLVIVALLILVFRRLPTPWVDDLYRQRMLAHLISIEATVRNVPVEQVEEESANEIERAAAIHDATPLRHRMWR
jgi:hypothetical protein